MSILLVLFFKKGDTIMARTKSDKLYALAVFDNDTNQLRNFLKSSLRRNGYLQVFRSKNMADRNAKLWVNVENGYVAPVVVDQSMLEQGVVSFDSRRKPKQAPQS
jgi:hypothetical protein